MTKLKVTINDYDMANIFHAYADDNGYQFFNLLNNIYIDPNIDPTLYTSHYYSPTDDWYSLSNQYYQTPKLWWVILVINQISNPFDELVAGRELKIPKSELLSNIITQINKVK